MTAAARRPHHQVTFAVLAVGVAAFALLQSLVVPVLSTLQADLHTTQNTVTWVLTAYLLSASIFAFASSRAELWRYAVLVTISLWIGLSFQPPRISSVAR